MTEEGVGTGRARRSASIAALAFSVLPGWLVVSGTALTAWLYDRTQWSTVPFLVGIFGAVAILRWGRVALPDFPKAVDVGRIPWFSGMAEQFYLSRAYLVRRAEAAGVSARLLIVAAWSPWWAMAGFWVLLMVSAIVDFLP